MPAKSFTLLPNLVYIYLLAKVLTNYLKIAKNIL